MPKGMTTLLVVISIALGLMLSGCGDGGSSSSSSSGSGAASALTVAGKVSVVDSSSGTNKAVALKIANFKLASSDVPANSDYNNDSAIIYVEERSSGAFDIINEILCMMDQTKYDLMLNLGDYKAQIDMNQCASGNDDASSAGQSSQNQSSGGSQPDYETWTVNSSRVDGSSPHIVKAWVHEEGDSFEPGKVIYIKTSITEGTSSTNPYGIFDMNFKAYPETSGVVDTSATQFTGYMKTEVDSGTNQVLLKFVVDGGFDTDNDNVNDVVFNEKVTLNRTNSGSTGGGTISVQDSFQGQAQASKFNIAFNAANFLREDTESTSSTFGNQFCLSRTGFDETVWRYGLYDSNGSRVTRNSGFPVKFDPGAGDVFGWVGYYGMWFPAGSTPSNGATVYKMDYSAGTEVPHTVFVSGGKLLKHTKNTLTLGEIKGVPLDWNNSNNNYRVNWDGTNFNIVSQLNTSTYLWVDATGTMDLTALPWTDLNFWSQGLGGDVRIKLSGCTDNGNNTFDCSGQASDSSVVAFFSQDVVYPSDTVPTTLSCLDNCPDQANMDQANPYLDTSSIQYQNTTPGNATFIDYTFSTSGMMLQYSGQDVILATVNNSQQWGVTSGPLFDSTDSIVQAALVCDFDSGSTCGWQAWSNLSVFYTWETGPNDWNKFTALRDAGDNYLTFDAPLQVKYTHTGDGYSNATFYLDYGGFGDLRGIPGKCVNFDDGTDVDCGPNTRWIPEFSITDGAEVTSGATSYLVKAMEKEQRMQSVSASNCSSLSLTTYTLPDISLWVDPAIGAEPAIDAAPAVVGGVLQ